MISPDDVRKLNSTARVEDLRERVRRAFERPPVRWEGPERIDGRFLAELVPVRKARAIATKLAEMPPDLWAGQLIVGSMTLEQPRLHAEAGFPEYLTAEERQWGQQRGLGTNCFGHIVPDYPRLLSDGLWGLREHAEAQRSQVRTEAEDAFLDGVVIALDAVMDLAARLAWHCHAEAERAQAAADPAGGKDDPRRARALELGRMAANLRVVPAGPAKTFWQALQSVWLLHMVFHSTRNANALGRLDQYVWPLLAADLEAGRVDAASALELVECFCLKFNERAKATEEQRPEHREAEPLSAAQRTRHGTSSQLGRRRDRLDATNHWLQNIVIGGLTPDGGDGTNPLTYLLLEAYRRNRMTNPLLTVRLHRRSPAALLAYACEVLKEGGGMPALFNDEQIVGALERIGTPAADARDYTNDGCWEVIIPGRTDFGFLRVSLMLCLEWVLNRGVTRISGEADGIDTGDPRRLASFEELWQAYCAQLDALIARTVERVVGEIDSRSLLAPVPLLSALIEGCIDARRDLTAGGARFRTFALLAESAAHAIDSLTALKTVVFEEGAADMGELCDALDANFEGHERLQRRLRDAPKYGNDDDRADAVGRRLIDAFTETVARHGEAHRQRLAFPCGVATFSWYVGIGEGLGASPDGRRAGEPVSSNFSPALGRDLAGLPAAILSYARMHDSNLPAGGPLDLRLAGRLVRGPQGTERMVALLRSFVETGGSMMTLTVADTEELRAAQRQPGKYQSLRVRMGGWSAYFTMLSREQQDHHIRRQEGRR